MSFNVHVDLSGALTQLGDIKKRVSEAVRPATLKGAMLIRQEVERRAPQSEKAHWFYSRRLRNGTVGKKYLFQSGSLKKSIYIKYIDEHSHIGEKAQYQISWRKQSSQLGYVPYAHMVEYGTATQPAHPFLRPAYDVTRKQAEQIIVDTIMKAAHDGT